MSKRVKKKDNTKNIYTKKINTKKVNMKKTILCTPKGHNPTEESHLSIKLARQLYELLPNLTDSVLGCSSYEFGITNLFTPGKCKLPFGCDIFDISKKLTVDELNALISSCSFFVSKKKAYIIFHHTSSYLKSCYYNMMNDVWEFFNQYSSIYEIPNDVQRKFWKECEHALTRNLMEMEFISKNHFYCFIKRKIKTDRNFLSFLKNYRKLWYAVIEGYEKQWYKILMEKVNNYKLLLDQNIEKETSFHQKKE
ncbi:RAD protein [Plasmodium ovale curtisi]|uniref:RAD protein n=2 Tax=Plasmodium ovale curtisi TaxID=864141 RepID=A0A1A8WAJ8_PLAOA|nr:RAD protein [Plasmodium ovale curtisi]